MNVGDISQLPIAGGAPPPGGYNVEQMQKQKAEQK